VSVKQLYAANPELYGLRRSTRAPKAKEEAEPEPEPSRKVKKGKKGAKIAHYEVKKKIGRPKKRHSDSDEEDDMSETSESDGEYYDDDDRPAKKGSRTSQRKGKYGWVAFFFYPRGRC